MKTKETTKQLEKFIDKKIQKYTGRDEYKGVTYNVGYVDALLTVQKFIEDIKK